MAGFGKIFWFGVAGLVASVVLFLSSVGGPHLRAESSTNTVALITAATGLISAIAVLIGAIDKFRSGRKPNQPSPEPERDDIKSYEPPRRGRRRDRRGEIVRFVERDSSDDRYVLVHRRRFEGYDRGEEVWTDVETFREFRG
jgi:hypothetical protein